MSSSIGAVKAYSCDDMLNKYKSLQFSYQSMRADVMTTSILYIT